MSFLSRVVRSAIPFALVLSQAMISPVRAEVSARVSGFTGNYQVSGVIVLGIITDDPGPFGSVWHDNGPASLGRRVLNAEGAANGDGEPTVVLLSGSNIPVVAWSRNSPSGFDVVLSRIADDQWAPVLPLADGPADELDPFLVQNPVDGSVHLLYWVLDGSPRVMRRSAPADLSSWTPAEQVSAPGAPAVRPTAIFRDGKLSVAYEVHDLGYGTAPRQIVVATEQVQGWTYEMIDVTLHPGPNRPTIRSTPSRVWVEWVDSDGQLAWVRNPDEAGWEPPCVEDFEGVEDRDYHAPMRIKLLAVN